MRKSQRISSNILKEYTHFERRVYQEVSTIGFGEVRTYKEIAKRLRCPLAYRAVGNALKKNPLPFIIPCHRVIKSNRDIGGFVYGERTKKRLLQFEKDFSKKVK